MESEWVEDLRNWAHSAPLVSKVWIFGSRAKGTHKENSDLDVAIDLKLEDENEKLSVWISNKENWKAELQNLFQDNPVVDLQLIFDDDEIVHPAVSEHGIIIYPPEFSG